MRRRIHYAAERQVRSGNIAPFASRNLLVSSLYRLCLRTSRAAGLLRLTGAVGVVILAAAFNGAWSLLSAFALALALAVFLTSWRSLLPRRAWEDPSTLHINRLPTHSRLRNYSSFDQAAGRDQESPNVVSLSGTWKFLLATGVSKAPAGFEHPRFSDGSWDDIAVPGHWQLQDAGSRDPPIYTNTNYPFPNHPPYAPRKNPTGLYRRRFSLPEAWLESCEGSGRASGTVNEGAVSVRLKGRVVLTFQGVDSAFHVWVNGLPVGFAKGSRLPCEFDVTDALRGRGEQFLCLRVMRWSDGSYLEDQDHWWLSGVYREVELALRPAPTRISDFVVRPFLSEDNNGAYTRGALEVEVLLEHSAAPTQLSSPTSADGWILGNVGGSDPATGLKGRGRSRRNRTSGDYVDGEGDHQRASFPLGEIESGGVGGWGNRADARAAVQGTGLEPAGGEEEVQCILVDTATGQRFPLEFSGSLPDWQMGLPPADTRQQRQQQLWQDQNPNTVVEGNGSPSSRFWPWSRLRGEAGRSDTARFGGSAVGDAPRGVRTPARSPLASPSASAGDEKKSSVRLFRLEVPGTTRAWSAEDPQLYTLVLRLSSRRRGTRAVGGDARVGEASTGASSLPEQFESARVGFRSVVVSSGQLLVNGSPVMVAGVNRHEHDPDTGKTVSEASMRRDIVMMKRFNFNAVRNCHYPNHWRWYELCDELGLYVCDEANIETHGQIPLGRLSADPSWRTAYLDRVWRMLAANKNHPCVILWSLGNESGDGENFTACRRLVKEVDPSRPVVYEGGGESLAEGCGCTELTDIVCPMYPSVERTELLGKDGPEGAGETRPCVLCEYSHAMGNSNGNLHKYWELFRKHRRLQGGFIWDWVDQGLTKHDASTGRRYWADGAGFAGGHSKGYDAFCVNGVTFPDRSPHPALHEAKFLAQPLGIELLPADPSCRSFPPRPPSPSASSSSPRRGETQGPSPAETETLSLRLRFTNRYGMSSLEHLSTQWRLESSAVASSVPTDTTDSSLAGGRLSPALSGLGPGDSRELTVEVDPAAGAEKRARGGRRAGQVGGRREEFFLHVEARLAADSAWAPRDHLVARGCFSITDRMPAGELPLPPPPPPPPQSAFLSGGVSDAAQRGGGGGKEAAATTATVPSRGFILYGEEDDSARSSAEVSPQGQLRQHLLTSGPAPPLASGMIVMKGLLDHSGGTSGADQGAAAATAADVVGEQLRFPREWTIVVSKAEGTIVRFLVGGVDLIEPGSGPSLCFWRAATDNDRAGWPSLLNFVVDHRLVELLAKFLPLSRLSHLERWNTSGLSASDPPVFNTQDVRVEKSSAQECIIKVKTSCICRRRRVALFDIITEMRVSPGGSVEIVTDVEPRKGVLRDRLSLARVGMLLRLPAGFGRVEWFGKGPFECYQDRKHGATTGVFSGTVEDQHVPYIIPSENGGKADVRWMALRRGEGGTGLLMQAETGTVFEAASVSLHSAAELDEAGRTVDLPERTSSVDPVFVHLDHRSMGVGGDNSWYPNVVHEEYTVPANKSHRFRIRLEALLPGAAAAAQAAAR